jgi:hypothetical protein
VAFDARAIEYELENISIWAAGLLYYNSVKN